MKRAAKKELKTKRENKPQRGIEREKNGKEGKLKVEEKKEASEHFEIAMEQR